MKKKKLVQLLRMCIVIFAVLFLMKSEINVQAAQKAGLYQNGKLKYNWSQLTKKGWIKVDKNGVLTTNVYFSTESDSEGDLEGNNSSPKLKGKLVLSDKVKSIGEYGFAACHELTEITMPSSVTKIGENAFERCSKLQNISFSKNIKTIGSQAFRDCNALKKVTLPSKLTKIEKKVFEYCAKLTTVEISSSVTVIGSDAFYNCTSLKTIKLPEKLKEIGGGAFCSCRSLESVNIPAKVNKIGEFAFYDCDSINKITVHAENQTFDSRNKCNAIIRKKDNVLQVGCKNTVIPKNVTRIGNYAFSGIKNLKEITIGANVTSIGKEAFAYCENLKKVVFKDGNKKLTIEKDAFSETGIKELKLPDRLTKINDAFSYCYSLESITIGASLQNLDSYEFYECPKIKKFQVSEKNKKYDSRDNCNGLIETAANEMVRGFGCTTIPDGVVSIKGGAFQSCEQLKEITIPGSMQHIGESAFSYSGLKKVTISAGVTGMEDDIFEGCYDLSIVVLESGLKELGDGAFRYCFDLNQVEIPESVEKIGEHTFEEDELIHNLSSLPGSPWGAYECHDYPVNDCPLCGTGDGSSCKMLIASAVIEDYQLTYDGKEKNPEPIVKDVNGNVLSLGTDYILQYDKHNSWAGTHSMSVIGTGDYRGCLDRTYVVLPTPLENVQANLYEYDKILVSWNAIPGVEGYYVYYRKSGAEEFELKKTARNAKWRFGWLEDGTEYEFKVIPFINYYSKSGEKVHYTPKNADVVNAKTLKQVNKPVIEQKDKDKVKLTWKTVDGATGYQISQTLNKNKESVVMTVNGEACNSAEIPIDAENTFYYKVRVYKTVVIDGETKDIFGPWSKYIY